MENKKLWWSSLSDEVKNLITKKLFSNNSFDLEIAFTVYGNLVK